MVVLLAKLATVVSDKQMWLKMKCLIWGVSLFLVFCNLSNAADNTVYSVNPSITVRSAERTVDLVTQLVKINTQLVFKNSGKDPVNYLLYAVEPLAGSKLSHIQASLIDGKTPTSAPIKKIDRVQGHIGSGNLFFRISLKEQLTSEKTVTISVESVFTHHLTPHPSEITQKEKQLVIYNGNHYVYSPYSIAQQSTRVVLGTRNIESYTKLKHALSGETITYGPYQNIAPFSEDALSIHYENNSPFLTIKHLERVIEVSHWGNIAIEETLDLEHTGARLKGPFSRYEYQRESQSGVASVKSFKTILPASATDAYYRDEIGNISTSNMRVLSDMVELDLRPRFPLFGGWKTHYVIGYNVPSYEYLYAQSGKYLLKIRFIDHAFDDMVVEEAVTKIILPEGCHSIQVQSPYEIERLPDSLHFTYLDTKGRPVLVLRKTNLVENHIQDLQIRYEFPRMLMLQEPLLVVIALYLLFLLVIIYVRLDFSISKDEASEHKLRIAGYIDKILNHQMKRISTYDDMDKHLNTLKTNKDLSSFNTSIKQVNSIYKNETQHIADLLQKLKVDGPEVSDKITELQKHDKALKEICNQQQALYVDKVIPNKISRSAFLDADGAFNKKKIEHLDKINSIVKSLQH